MEAYVLIKTRIGDIQPALQILRRTGGVVSAYATFGSFDIVAQVEAGDLDGLGNLVTRQIAGISEIADTSTLIFMNGNG